MHKLGDNEGNRAAFKEMQAKGYLDKSLVYDKTARVEVHVNEEGDGLFEFTRLLDGHPVVAAQKEALAKKVAERLEVLGNFGLYSPFSSAEEQELTWKESNPEEAIKRIRQGRKNLMSANRGNYLYTEDPLPVPESSKRDATETYPVKILGKVTPEKLEKLRSELLANGFRFSTLNEVEGVAAILAAKTKHNSRVTVSVDGVSPERTALELVADGIALSGLCSGAGYISDGNEKMLPPVIIPINSENCFAVLSPDVLLSDEPAGKAEIDGKKIEYRASTAVFLVAKV